MLVVVALGLAEALTELDVDADDEGEEPAEGPALPPLEQAVRNPRDRAAPRPPSRRSRDGWFTVTGSFRTGSRMLTVSLSGEST
jgi:hypothetical protein